MVFRIIKVKKNRNHVHHQTVFFFFWGGAHFYKRGGTPIAAQWIHMDLPPLGLGAMEDTIKKHQTPLFDKTMVNGDAT